MSHWIFENKPYNPDYEDIDAAGFCYLITNNLTGMMYIGRKIFHKRRTLPALKGKKRKRKLVLESDWRGYTSSSIDVNNDIEKLGKENFIFEILSFHINRIELNYHEIKLQFLFDVLECRDAEGNRRFYNKNIVNKFYPSALHWEDRKQLRESFLKLATDKCILPS